MSWDYIVTLPEFTGDKECKVNGAPLGDTITNYDRIIGKTPEELAKWLWFRVGKCPPFDVCPSPCIPCEPKDCWLDWLKQKEE